MREIYNLQRPRHIDDTQSKQKNILTDDFQSDINDELTKALHIQNVKSNSDRKDMTIVVEIQANRKYRLIGLLKNILDAFQGVLYIDDSGVKSVLIYRVQHDIEHKDRMKIWVLENVVIRGCHVDEVTLENNTLVYAEFDTVLEDNYLLYQEGMEVSGEVVEDTRVMGESLFGEMGEMVEEAEVSLHLITDSNKADIDNIALNVVASMVGRAVHRVEDIKMLNIYRETDRRRRSSWIEVEIGREGDVIYKKEGRYINKCLEDIKGAAGIASNVVTGGLLNMPTEAERRE